MGKAGKTKGTRHDADWIFIRIQLCHIVPGKEWGQGLTTRKVNTNESDSTEEAWVIQRSREGRFLCVLFRSCYGPGAGGTGFSLLGKFLANARIFSMMFFTDEGKFSSEIVNGSFSWEMFSKLSEHSWKGSSFYMIARFEKRENK